MRLDNECDVAFEVDESDALAESLRDFRSNLLAEHLGVAQSVVADAIAQQGSIIGAIETLRHDRQAGQAGTSRTLIPYETPEISGIEQWLADNEILDPEGPEAVYEPIEKRGLFRGSLRVPFRKR
jgi:hypothetical protein